MLLKSSLKTFSFVSQEISSHAAALSFLLPLPPSFVVGIYIYIYWGGVTEQIGVYHKDVDFAYKPFLSLLGTGIVTSDGQKWRKQRNKVLYSNNFYRFKEVSDLCDVFVCSCLPLSSVIREY